MNRISATIIIYLIATFSGHSHGEVKLTVWPDSVVTGVSTPSTGINLNYFMDGDRFDSQRPLAEALKELNTRFLRYPGGEKSDHYMFSTYPYNQSHPAVTRTEGLDQYPGMFNPDGTLIHDPLDFDEFIDLCRKINAEPVVVVAADRYLMPVGEGKRGACRDSLISHAAAWVRYSNITRQYGVRYWMIGNESWNDNNPGSSAAIYARDVVDFSRAMKAVDPTILTIANGDNEPYFKTVIEIAGDEIDRLCVSNYGIYDFTRGYESYRDSTRCLVYPAMTALNAMKRYSTQSQQNKLKLIVAEYGTIDWFGYWKGINDMGHAIATFDMTGQLRLLPGIEFSCFWNTRWIENDGSDPQSDHDAINLDASLNPTGVALKMWNMYPAASMVKCISSSPQIICYAATTIENDSLIIYILNKDGSSVNLDIDIKGKAGIGKALVHEYYGTSPDDLQPQWNNFNTVLNHLVVKGYSINIVRLN